MSYLFISSPYTHPDRAVREARYLAVARYTAALMREGVACYSPVVHGHNLAGFGLPLDHDFWMRQCLPLLLGARELRVLAIDGWHESRGVQTEIAKARNWNMPVTFATSVEDVACAFEIDPAA